MTHMNEGCVKLSVLNKLSMQMILYTYSSMRDDTYIICDTGVDCEDNGLNYG